MWYKLALHNYIENPHQVDFQKVEPIISNNTAGLEAQLENKRKKTFNLGLNDMEAMQGEMLIKGIPQYNIGKDLNMFKNLDSTHIYE